MIHLIVPNTISGLTRIWYDAKQAILSPVEKWSTYSNITYMIVGLILMAVIPVWEFGAVLIVLGYASFMYHGTKKKLWQTCDEIMMYITFIFLHYTLFYVYSSELTHLMFLILSISLSILCALQWKILDSMIMAPVLFIIALAVYVTLTANWLLAGCILIYFIRASMLNLYGRNHKEYEDRYHTMWHIMTAIGFSLFFI